MDCEPNVDFFLSKLTLEENQFVPESCCEWLICLSAFAFIIFLWAILSIFFLIIAKQLKEIGAGLGTLPLSKTSDFSRGSICNHGLIILVILCAAKGLSEYAFWVLNVLLVAHFPRPLVHGGSARDDLFKEIFDRSHVLLSVECLSCFLRVFYLFFFGGFFVCLWFWFWINCS